MIQNFFFSRQILPLQKETKTYISIVSYKVKTGSLGCSIGSVPVARASFPLMHLIKGCSGKKRGTSPTCESSTNHLSPEAATAHTCAKKREVELEIQGVNSWG